MHLLLLQCHVKSIAYWPVGSVGKLQEVWDFRWCITRQTLTCLHDYRGWSDRSCLVLFCYLEQQWWRRPWSRLAHDMSAVRCWRCRWTLETTDQHNTLGWRLTLSWCFAGVLSLVSISFKYGEKYPERSRNFWRGETISVPMPKHFFLFQPPHS